MQHNNFNGNKDKVFRSILFYILTLERDEENHFIFISEQEFMWAFIGFMTEKCEQGAFVHFLYPSKNFIVQLML